MTVQSKLSIPNQIRLPIQKLGLGVFDGFHRGHQVIASQCDALLTLHPHPDIVLNKQSTLRYLTTLSELLLLYPNVITLPFNKKISLLSAEDFLTEIIEKQLAPRSIICGHDYTFGYKKSGNSQLLQEWAKKKGITVDVISEVSFHDEIVRSSHIRTLLKKDQFDKAIHILGHPYLIQGKVIRGDGRGKKLGFPTANIHFVKEKCLPAPGVYKGFAIIKKQRHKAMIYIGSKPTFTGSDTSVEAHILDFEEDIYDNIIELYVESHIRTEKSFKSKENLVAQIQEDIKQSYGH